MSEEALEAKRRYLRWAIEHQSELTDDELHAIIQVFFGFHIPRAKVCDHHCAPFDFVSDAIFERVQNCIVLANRNGGKTQNFGIINAYDITFKGVEVASVGAVLDQADKCYQYTSKCMNSDGFKDLLVDNLKSQTTTKTGGLLQILAGTMRGVNGPHPEKANLDEVELMDRKVLQEAMSMPKSSPRGKAAMRLTSTRKFAFGPMQELLDEAERRGLKVYQWCIWEVIEPCKDTRSGTVPVFLDFLPPHAKNEAERMRIKVLTKDEILRDKVLRYEDVQPHMESGVFSGCLNCPLVTVCQTKAKRSDGYYSIDDTIDKYKTLDEETWETQWICSKPGRTGAVYPMFDDTEGTGHVRAFDVQPNWRFFGCQDFGFTNPAVGLIVAVDPEENVYVVDEEYDTKTPLASLAQNKYKALAKKYNVEAWYCDPSGADQIATMSLYGIPSAAAHTNNIDAGIGVVRYFMRTPMGQRKLFVHPRCVRLIKDLNNYHYKEGTDKPEKDKDDHGADALRYFFVSRFPQLLEQIEDGPETGMPYPDYERQSVEDFQDALGPRLESTPSKDEDDGDLDYVF